MTRCARLFKYAHANIEKITRITEGVAAGARDLPRLNEIKVDE